MPKEIGKYIVYPFYEVGQNDDWMANTYRGLPVPIDNITYPTTEHYFHCMKFPGNSTAEQMYRAKILAYNGSFAVFPKEARNIANEVFKQYGFPPKYNPATHWKEWDEKRSEEVMTVAVRAKLATYPGLKQKLIQRPIDSIIVEATQNDSVWADHNDGTGKNKLGKIYMKELRRQHLDAGKPGSPAVDTVDKDYDEFNKLRLGKSLYSYPESAAVSQAGDSKHPEYKGPLQHDPIHSAGDSKQPQQTQHSFFKKAGLQRLTHFDQDLLHTALANEIKLPIPYEYYGTQRTLIKLVFNNQQDLETVFQQLEGKKGYHANNIRKEEEKSSEPKLSIEIPPQFLSDNVSPEDYLRIFLKIAKQIKKLESEYQSAILDKGLKGKKLNGLKELMRLITDTKTKNSLEVLITFVRSERISDFQLDMSKYTSTPSSTTNMLNEIYNVATNKKLLKL